MKRSLIRSTKCDILNNKGNNIIQMDTSKQSQNFTLRSTTEKYINKPVNNEYKPGASHITPVTSNLKQKIQSSSPEWSHSRRLCSSPLQLKSLSRKVRFELSGKISGTKNARAAGYPSCLCMKQRGTLKR